MNLNAVSLSFQTLSEKHFETKFAKISVEKAKFFAGKLKIQVLPAVFCFNRGVVVDRLVLLFLMLHLLHISHFVRLK